MRNPVAKPLATALSTALLLALGGCGSMAGNPSLESVHQPVVSRTNYTLDLATSADGLAVAEQRRLAGWFEALDLRYGDRVSLDDPLGSSAARQAIEAVAGRYGLLLADSAPVTPGTLTAGAVRVVVSRSTATVPGCPDWSARSENRIGNGTGSNYGCATNSNLAAMVADPEHLLKGASGQSGTTVMSSTKAIDSYRQAPPTGENGLSKNSTQSGGK